MKKSLEEFDPRTVAREPVAFVRARILTPDGYALRTCTLCNLSRSGAMLRASVGLPPNTIMGLLIDGEQEVRNFEIVWQTATHTGVRFITPDRRSADTGSDLMGRSALGTGWLPSHRT